ncbi:ArsC family reductase [Methylophaga sp. UBA678]|uniref:ArsC family reductase n=1 Tax=Methylophaga sp. UBA678 TaxID=1946901 RepID=UPI00259D27C9|nr:ArsC family reductase [Methylophaga sp. UBA678]|tara:strand:- start:71064 stop:71402 length:339 start_codon:yes stop_codon:yes gene_type:complete
MILYGIKNCDSVKKARSWLEAHSIDYVFHDFRQQGLEESTVKEWLQSVDWETLLNKRGTTWRKLDDPRKDNLDEKTAIELMLENPTLIKRPVLVNDSTIIVGFKEDVYQQLV